MATLFCCDRTRLWYQMPHWDFWWKQSAWDWSNFEIALLVVQLGSSVPVYMAKHTSRDAKPLSRFEKNSSLFVAIKRYNIASDLLRMTRDSYCYCTIFWKLKTNFGLHFTLTFFQCCSGSITASKHTFEIFILIFELSHMSFYIERIWSVFRSFHFPSLVLFELLNHKSTGSTLGQYLSSLLWMKGYKSLSFFSVMVRSAKYWI